MEPASLKKMPQRTAIKPLQHNRDVHVRPADLAIAGRAHKARWAQCSRPSLLGRCVLCTARFSAMGSCVNAGIAHELWIRVGFALAYSKTAGRSERCGISTVVIS